MVAEGLEWAGQAEILGPQKEGDRPGKCGQVGEGDGARGEAGPDQSVRSRQLAEVVGEGRRAPQENPEERSGGRSHRFGIPRRGPLAKDDPGSAEGSGIADNGAQVAGVGDFGQDHHRAWSGDEGRKGGILGFTSNREVTAMEVKSKKFRGFSTGEIGADPQDSFHRVGRGPESLDGMSSFHHEVGVRLAGREEGLPVQRHRGQGVSITPQAATTCPHVKSW